MNDNDVWTAEDQEEFMDEAYVNDHRVEPLVQVVGVEEWATLSDTQRDGMREQLIAEAWGLA